jgi:dienelactone hydrolase
VLLTFVNLNLRRELLRTIIAIYFCAAISAFAQVAPVDLTGGLRRGPFAVGFRVLYKHDLSRTWKTTVRNGAAFSPDPEGRPVRIEIWYPAIVATEESPMKYGDYISLPAPQVSFAALKSLEAREHLIATLSVPPEKLDALLATPVTAHMDAPAVRDRFPLLIHFPGLNDAQALNEFVMAEFLASHGYVVAVVSLLGSSDFDTDQHRDPRDIESSIRDAEFAWGILRTEPYIDANQLAVSGQSLGAIEAALFAMRNANTSAMIGLEGTYGFAGASEVLTKFYSYSPKRMTASILDLRKNAAQQQTVFDLSALQDMHFSDRTLITVDEMHHSDFTSFAVAGYLFGMPTTYTPTASEHHWDRESGYRGYLNVCRLVLDYLDQVLKHDEAAAIRLRADLVKAKDGTYEHIAAAPLPPSPKQIVEVGDRQGFEAAKTLIDELCKNLPVDWVVNESTFNSLGYALLAEKRAASAIIAFRLNVNAHPTSSNASDSLADGYVAAGDNAHAIAALEAAISAAAHDSSLNDPARWSFIADEQTKIERLRTAK